MLCETFEIKQEGSLEGRELTTYIVSCVRNSYVKERPCVIVVPGGGYAALSMDREGEAMAIRFNSMGYQAVVLKYSIKPATYPTQILEIAQAISIVREHAKEWNIDPNKILLCGSSAGGHAIASYGCFWHEDFVAEALGVSDKEQLRPNGLILCYPVITSGEFANRHSIVNLCGDRYDALLERVSLENQVNEFTPKCFIWHTFADPGVPVENSLLFASALREQNIPFELHIYPEGDHGLALADWTTQCENGWGLQEDCQSWVDLVQRWIKKL